MNLALFHFIRPYWLLALIPWLLLSVFIIRRKLHGGNWAAVCDEALLPYILEQKATRHSKMPLISMSLASFLTILALAGPTWERIPTPAFRNESGLVIALNLSKSMEAEDIKPNRLVRARYKIADILKTRKDGQSALLVYSGDAFTVTPLTNDNATIISQLEALTPDIMPSAGNNAVLAVEKAVELLKQAGLQKGQILLVTDSINADEQSDVLQKLQSYQLSVLAVGTEQGAPISLPEGGFLKDDSGAIVMPKLSTALLQNLAQAGGGIYQEITDDDRDIKMILASVDKSVQNLRNSGDNSNKLLLDKWDEKGVWLLLLILPLAALNFRRGLLSLALLFLLPIPKNSYAMEWQDLWQSKDQQGYSAYQHGDYEKAAKLFQDPAWQAASLYKSKQPELNQLKTPNSATGFYNQGNVLAKAGKYEEAIKAYEQALKQNPDKKLKDDALYNKKLVEETLKKQQQQNQNSQNSQNNQQNASDNKNQQKSENKSANDKQNNQNQPQNKDNQDSQKNQSDNSQKKQEQQKPAEDNKVNPENQPQQQQSQKQDLQNSQDLQKQQQMAAQDKNKPSEQPAQQVQAQWAKQQENEKKQADEQWLNRIPDDPAGLLRRKFEYQYRQRGKSAGQNW